MVSQKFDETAAVEPYPFIGAVARSHEGVLHATIDRMVQDPHNVVVEEAVNVWGLPAESYTKLKSHSATDISESAFKYFGGDLHRFENNVGPTVWNNWKSNAAEAKTMADTVLAELESDYAAKETRKADLTHALFHLGKLSDGVGRVRIALAFKSTLMNTKAAKHYVDTGKSLQGDDINAEEAAMAASKKESAKRKRVAPPTPKSDQYNVRYTMLTTQLRDKGLELKEDKEEREFIENGPTGLGKIMATIADIVHRRAIARGDESSSTSEPQTSS